MRLFLSFFVTMLIAVGLTTTLSATVLWRDPEIVDSGSGWIAWGNDLLIRPSGIPVLSYYRSPDLALRFAERRSGGWEVEEVSVLSSNRSTRTSLAFDAAGNSVIAYHNGDLVTLARNNGSSWSLETAGAASDPEYVAFASSAAGEWIAYTDGMQSLRFGAKSGTNWDFEEVTGSAAGVDLALAPDGAPMLLFEAIGEGMKFAIREGEQWEIELIENNATAGGYYGLEVDTAGIPHVVYVKDNRGILVYAVRNDDLWSREEVASGEEFRQCSIALDRDRQPWITAFDRNNLELLLFERNQSAWVDTLITPAGTFWCFHRLRIDDTGHFHVSYYGTEDQMMYIAGEIEATPTPRPTDTPTPTPTPTPPPALTATPSPFPTPTPGPTHSPSPTPGMAMIELTLEMPQVIYRGGDMCYLDLRILNTGSPRDADLYVLLDVFGQYWFYPSWRPLDQGLDFASITFDTGESAERLIPQFQMPPVSTGGPFYFHAAAFEPGTVEVDSLVTNIASIDFSLQG